MFYCSYDTEYGQLLTHFGVQRMVLEIIDAKPETKSETQNIVAIKLGIPWVQIESQIKQLYARKQIEMRASHTVGNSLG